jgi:hypothetical protein
MSKHMTRTSPTIKCDFCEKMFVTQKEKKDHQRCHTRPTVSCTLCAKVYSNSSGLYRHMETVHAGIRYVCNVCPENVASKGQLYDHYFVHRGFRPYHCNVCPYQESRKFRLVKHLKQHNVEYNVRIHGYIEQDPEIHKIIDGCIRRNGDVNVDIIRRESKKAATTTNETTEKTTESLTVDSSADTSYQSAVQDIFYPTYLLSTYTTESSS